MIATDVANARYRAPRYTLSHTAGFTLIELLVSVAIFISVMAGVTLLLVGSTRTSQQGFQNQQAFEIARGAMGLMQRDLSRAFTARNHGDYYTFYGTPIGFTFVGVASPREKDDPNVARVTYVIHQRVGAAVLNDVAGNQRFIYDLIRFVEPNAEDLDSFDVEWDVLLLTDGSGDTLQDLIGDPVTGLPAGSAVADAILNAICAAADIPCLEQVVAAKRRELWIQMLSRMEPDSGNPFLPDLWAVLDNGAALDSLDYILAENILSEAFPAEDAFAPLMGTTTTVPFFEYAAFVDRRVELTGAVADASDVIATPIEITAFDHGLRTDRLVTITGVEGNLPANGTFYITVIDTDTFSLQGTAGTGANPYTQGGTWTEDGRGITNATNAGPIEITDSGHELTTGEEIFVSGVVGNTAANGRYLITVSNINTVQLDLTTGNGAYTGGGSWIRVGDIVDALFVTPIVIVDTDHGLQTGDEIIVSGVEGNTAANGRWFVTRIDVNNFSLDNSVSNNPATMNTGDWIEATNEVREKVAFWNDIRNQAGGLSNSGLLGTPLDPHMPEEILTRFTLFFQTPVPGAPDFERTFDQRIDVPAGYLRPARDQ